MLGSGLSWLSNTSLQERADTTSLKLIWPHPGGQSDSSRLSLDSASASVSEAVRLLREEPETRPRSIARVGWSIASDSPRASPMASPRRKLAVVMVRKQMV